MSIYAWRGDTMTPEEWNTDTPTHESEPQDGTENARTERGRAICEEALRTINGERQDQYGNPEDTFKQIAALWEAYLGTKVTPLMVADMMCLLKIAREAGGKGKRDNLVDLIGYAALGAAMRGYDV